MARRETLKVPEVHQEIAAAVAVKDLFKEYPAPDGTLLRAVDGISFEVASGEVFGLLGPNGAGKSTTLEIIESLRTPTSGRTEILGLDSHRHTEAIKQRIGIQLQSSAYFDFLTLREILDLFGSFYERKLDPDELLIKVGLEDQAKAKVRELSGGQAQQFSVAAAIVNDPDVVFFDEPTTGLEPNARRCLWDLIESINRDEKRTVILATRYVEEAETLCDRIAIIDHGKIAALDTPTELTRTLPAIMDRSRANAFALTDITLVTVKLEDVLLSRTGRGPRA